MPVVTTKEIVDRAFELRYGVPAVNVFNDLSMESVLSGAVEAQSPVIVQTSVKTVRSLGAATIYASWTAMTSGVDVPVALHLDHCPDRDVISECLRLGWNSVLFDASQLSVAENQRQTLEVVAEARKHGADVEGEIEAITGVEDGHGSDEESRRESLDTAVSFIRATGVDMFAPAIGNAHGEYRTTPTLDVDRVRDLVALTSVPIALHGGTGIGPEAVRDLISAGCAKVNVSTGLKLAFMKSSLSFLREAETRGVWDPPSLFSFAGQTMSSLTRDLANAFGSSGRAAL
ncbi:class II fructose-bisphosphate aldolase [Microbacterium sp. LWS13-1.2]